ncbi:MAG: hypothetical protein WCX74_01070 [Candidatus Paceibacterota bacterium]
MKSYIKTTYSIFLFLFSLFWGSLIFAAPPIPTGLKCTPFSSTDPRTNCSWQQQGSGWSYTITNWGDHTSQSTFQGSNIIITAPECGRSFIFNVAACDYGGSNCSSYASIAGTTCTLPLINGSCSSTHYKCNTGTSINNLQGGASWAWQCQGTNGGTTATCSESFPVSPVNGSCNNSCPYCCSSGSAINQYNNGNYYQWNCSGQNGGSNSGTCVYNNISACTWSCGSWDACHSNNTQYRTCSSSPSGCTGSNPYATSQRCQYVTPVNGSCSSAHYNCNAGTSINNLQGGVSWVWQCQGTNGGTTATCSQNFPSCNYNYGSWGVCNSGTQTRTATPTNSPCIGTPTTSQSCTTPVNGSCTSTHYNCNTGTSIYNLQGGASWAWQCQGTNGGTTATCSQNFPSCTYTYGSWGTCINGTQTRTATATNSPCVGTPTTTQSCTTPINGSCNETHYNCNTGTSITNLQGGSSWVWQCQGSNGGTTATCSQSFPSCIYVYGSWGTCTNGTQTRTATAANLPCAGTPITNQPCGTCGPAAKTYLMGVVAYEGVQCIIGTPSNTAFPEKGATVTWTCNVVDGSASQTCSANRLNINPNWSEK